MRDADLIAEMHEWDRRLLEDLRANAPAMPPIVGTPKDDPNMLEEVWRQSVAAGLGEPHTGEAVVAGGITRQMMVDAAKLTPMYPCPVRRIFEIGTLSEIPTRPGPPFAFTGGVEGLVAMGGYELERTEYNVADVLRPHDVTVTGRMHVLPDAFETKTLLGDNMEETLKKCLAAYEGQAVTRQMIDKVSADVKAAIDAGRVMPFPIKFEPLNVDANLLAPRDLLDRGMEALINGFDWAKEQKAIAEESRYQATMQGKLQEEMEQSTYHLKAMQEEAAIDAELARMTDDGAKCPLPADPLLTIEPGEFHARVRDMVTRRHPDPACHMTADLKERRLKEEFLRHHIPPPPITDADLDRSVPTNLPVDQAHDTPYQTYRRERSLPDTMEVMQQFLAHARIYNNIVKGGGLAPPIPEDHITAIGQQLIQAQLSSKHTGRIFSFEAYETVGVTPAHVASCVKTDDPELMAALGDAIDQGRVVMDGDSILAIDGLPMCDPDKLSDADKAAILKNGWHEGTITHHAHNPDGSESMTIAFPKTPFEDDVKPDAVVG